MKNRWIGNPHSAIRILFLLAALATPAATPPEGLPAFRHQAVVIDHRTLKYNPCDDAMFPCVIEAASYFPKPLGRFYLYYAPHNAPGGICLAFADRVEGPWKEYQANPLIAREWPPHYKVSHVCSAHAIWNEEEKQVFLYYHGENTVTRYATTRDGLHFTYGGTAVDTAMFDGISEASYARVFRHALPGQDNRYVMIFMGNNKGTRRIYLAWSRDGRQWTARRAPLIDPPPVTTQVASPFLFPWRGKNYVIYHAEELTQDPNRPQCDLHVSEVNAALEPVRYLGRLYRRGQVSPDNPRVDSGQILEADGKVYLFHTIGPRLNQNVALAVAAGAAPTTAALAAGVRRIDWARFAGPVAPDPELEQCGRILLNTTRWCAAWAAQAYKPNGRGDRYDILNKNAENVIRPPASAASGLAIVLKTGLYDERAIGVGRAELTRRALHLIKGLAAIHKTSPGGAWGDHWQSSLWASLVVHAAWMMWDELDDETRAAIVAMTVHEADRHIAPGYRVPYWNGKGGDTKAEENAWETTILQLAVAMLPDHPHAPQWRQVCCELLISAYARESDVKREDARLDGKTPRQWLKGYNIREDGSLLNHNLIHDDYMTCVSLNLRALLVCSLAGIPAPQTYDFNAALIYGALQTIRFASPPYRAPGGTMYVPGQADLYYPQGTDWSRCRFEVYYQLDGYAAALGLDRGLDHPAREWLALRGARMLQMQGRFEDGRMYTNEEFKSYNAPEQCAMWVMSDAYLLQWLNAHGALSAKASWE